MVGKFLERDAIIDTIKSEERTNARQNRSGKPKHHVGVTSCGCPDPNCGAFHTIELERPLPTEQEALETLRKNRQNRKASVG